ncbi:UDP-N-acetylmuramoyl-L-alanine--D-glutamate ligase [Endozoicomonas numazuensis]|uniref:UDP-N-acetylmuramoylalanine--D-glutamate ligase n=1 Tax=Endozoicomonas numazuensis TaxID=1137799 RepID=A0A081NE89_9GAMM|nr:UDP-N-acetylmuramoyl-L-alanine--D-glutamate ligase [Endozoicomonas numazuensis]KEQ16762.1 UDP-N-acetylmuramoyl-L-alanyl-D-glutamate synthetase [Endozoicomonas numazuensis]
MSALISSNRTRVVVGLGKTGLSCVRFLAERQRSFKVMDTRENPPGIDELRASFPDIPVHLGGLNSDWLLEADELILSPGIALSTPEIAEAVNKGAEAVGDIELFCREVDKPVVAITGSNGKSTVTTLLGEMAEEAGLSVAVGGNIGTPALELLEREGVDLYILELSSFQLETTHSLRAAAATVLNVSPDHMDRYASMMDYHKAKQRIYRGCKHAVYNKQDALTVPLLPQATPATAFTSGKPDLHDYGLIDDDEGTWLCKGVERLLNTAAMKLPGRHNQMNALAALALGDTVGIPMAPMLSALTQFEGLAHRCQWVAEKNGVVWINDSKATNVGASVAAIEGLGETLSGKVVLIAGGDGKGADFNQLKQPLKKYGREVVLVGRDAADIAAAVNEVIPVQHSEDLAAAIERACEVSEKGDAVLLAPACASFDMFKSFEHRGDVFAGLVRERLA